MSTTVLGKPLTQTQLKEAILTFAQGRDTGYLGTVGPDGVRVSPVRYFMDNDLNVYIHSKGGTKFTTGQELICPGGHALQDDFTKSAFSCLARRRLPSQVPTYLLGTRPGRSLRCAPHLSAH